MSACPLTPDVQRMAGAEAEADEEEGSDLAPLLSGSTGRRAEVSPTGRRLLL